MQAYKCPKCGGKLKRNGTTPAGKQRWACRKITGNSRGGHLDQYCYATTRPESKQVRVQSGKGEAAAPPRVFKRKLKPTKRYIITAAQNATPVHEAFWEGLQTAAKHSGAELLVIPLRYRNPTSKWLKTDEEDDWWASAVMPYLWNVRKSLCANLAVLGDIKIQPTAVEPLTGLEGFSGTESSIVGHTKLALRTVPTPGHRMAKILTTTGACTVRNYSDTRAGKHGEFHHTLAACLVEIEGDKFWLRHLNADKHGAFTDLDKRFIGNMVRDAEPPAAIILGDTHVDFTDPLVDRATFGRGGLVPSLKPERIVWHDLLDAYSCNPHHRGNPFNAIAKLSSGLDDVQGEVMRAIDFVIKRTGDAKSFIVSSNHDDMLHRWILSHDWKADPRNAAFYLETALAMARGTTMGEGGTEYPRPFKYWVDSMQLRNITCLGGEDLVVAGVLLSMHGDRGPNGARGSIKNLRRIGSKSVIGHSHSPGISEGTYQVGTSSKLRLEYNGGPSGWLNTHCVLHADGKRQLITIIEGRYRL